MANVDHIDQRYLEKITSIQDGLRMREKRRLELERELFTYSRSDKRVYLQEISNREARAKMRNLELLRDVECMEISIRDYRPDRGPLQQQKANYFKRISSEMEARRKMQLEVEKAKVRTVSRKEWDTSHPAKDLTQLPVEHFLNHQTLRELGTETHTTSVHSPQASHRSPNRSRHSGKRLPSGLLKDFRVCGEDTASRRAHLSDDIWGSNDSPDDDNLGDKHDSAVELLPSVHALTTTARTVASGSDNEQDLSPLVTLTKPEKNDSLDSDGHVEAENAEHIVSQEEDKETRPGHLMPEEETAPGKQESASTSSSDVQLSESSASDLSISLTPSELEEDLPEGVASDRRAASAESLDYNQRQSPEVSKRSNGSTNISQLNSEPPALEMPLMSLSQEGLFNLLDSIEGRLHTKQTSVYGVSSIDGSRLNRIISLCGDGAGLNDQDLEACGAVVLHELQRLSWSTEKGCLLPQDLVSAHHSSTGPHEISTSLPPSAARLWDRWFKHALVLKEHGVLSTERLVQLFTPLLVKSHAACSHQAKVLLRTLLSRSSEENPSAEDVSDLSAASLPVSDVNPAKPGNRNQSQELQSSEEDSPDESPVESGPIRETKAYQLLKQSAMQERQQSSEEEDEDGLSGTNDSLEEDVESAKRFPHQDPYPWKEKIKSKTRSALQSKAFWGESEDSDSDIEAALRPRPLNTNSDDTDDFYS
ncbi:centrosomal protein kizuna isoform X2 [Gouania willdenowi]|uniref:centrosomal protein kizuna isoform X2 n=1 Tax=Gouania willdenowi TaxID=441366 RepID=UPI0010558465|nr:centrosomal protein kizuna isoform X2 [Gouania willdenowi]